MFKLREGAEEGGRCTTCHHAFKNVNDFVRHMAIDHDKILDCLPGNLRENLERRSSKKQAK